jgi:hypothetical protein
VKDRSKKQDHFFSILVLLIISGLTYLPLLGKFGYTNDDWYLMYAASAYGPNAFIDIFSVDRPGRVLVMIPAYELFGANPLFYNLSAFLFRTLGGVALLGLLRRLWSGRPVSAIGMAVLFLVYPGFLSMPNAIDYQSHIVGLAAALLSIWLTIQAVQSDRLLEKILSDSGAVLFGWLYLSQMEWYIGFEFFRWACVFLLASRHGGTVFQKGIRAIRCAYPSLLVPAAFLVWRLFFFSSQRGATDVDLQFELFKLYPVQTVYHWSIQVLQDLYDVLLAAWVIPLSRLLEYIEWWGWSLALIASGIVMFLLFKLDRADRRAASEQPNFLREALWLGILTAIAGLIPIAMVNREVAFPSFSRYALVSSVGVAIFLVALVSMIRRQILRSAVLATLLTIAMLTHHANSVKSAQETAIVRNFWWQVSWRIPQLETRATLIGNYPAGSTEEDYFIWGPANLIYYPENRAATGIQPALFAAILNEETVAKVLARERQEFDNRKNIITYKNYRNILILTQPTMDSCVHVIDGLQPEFSQFESESIREIGPYSELEHILVDETPHTPPTLVFGPEPDHGWCYYYQMADLARQRGDWEQVLRVGEEAFGKHLTPNDSVEWMPFLQAYAQSGDVAQLEARAPQITASPYIAHQACQIITAMPEVADSGKQTVASLYCAE